MQMGTQKNFGVAVGAAALSLVLAACGSQLDPGQVLAAGGTAPVGTVASDGSIPGALAPGDAAGGAGTPTGSLPGAPAAPGSDGGTSSGSGSDAAPSGENAADGRTEAASCDGLKNQVGVTSDTITIANASDISGPVPGLFDSAQLGTAAYVAYFNETSDICGRKLKLLALDSKSDAGGDQQAYTRACDEAFAAVGSQSIFDSGGASTAQACGIPDLRSGSLTAERSACSVCFPAQSAEIGVVSDAWLKFTRQQNPAATDKAAFLYLNAGGSPELAKSYSETAESVGYGVEMLTGIDVSESNYAPVVQQMKDKGIEYVSFVAASSHAVRMKQAMDQQGFEPEVYAVTQAQYSNEFVETGGASVDGTSVPLPHPLFTDTSNAEIQLYQSWLQQVSPGADPTSFGVFAWSAARLFVEKAIGLGGKLTRESLIGAVKDERAWDANGLHTPMDVGGKNTYKCTSIVELRDSTWTKLTPGKYICGSLVTTSVAR